MNEEQELYTMQEIADDLWRDAHLTTRARTALEQLEKRAYSTFSKALKPLGVDTKSAAKRLRASFRMNDPHDADQLTDELRQQAIEHRWTMGQYLAVLRAFNTYVGNHVAYNVHGEPYSPVIVRAYTAVSERYYHHYHELPERLEAVHAAIDAAVDLLIDPIAEDKQRIAKLEFDTSSVRRILDDLIARHNDARDIAHFALDWFVDEEPADIIKKTPEQSAVLLLLAVEEVNVYGPVKLSPFLDKPALAAYGGWKTAPRQSAIRVAEILHGALPSLGTLLLTHGVSALPPTFDDLVSALHEDGDVQMVGTMPGELDTREFSLRLGILFERYGLPVEEHMEKVRTMVYEMDKVGQKGGSLMQEYHEAFLNLFPESAQNNEQARMEIIANAVDAWNAFPHKCLGGKSPLDMVREGGRA